MTVRATDNTGATTTSAPVAVTVTSPANQPPDCQRGGVGDGGLGGAGDHRPVRGAGDSDGTVARVEFYQGTTRLGEDTLGAL